MNFIYFIAVFILFGGLLNPKKQKSTEFLGGVQLSQNSKGLAAFLVMTGHLVSSLKIESIQFLNVGWLCVAVFFFWSGYGVVYGAIKKTGYLNCFWKSRLIKILIPFFEAHIIYFVIKQIIGTRFSIKDIFLSFVGNCNVVDNSWYPIAIIIFYLLFFIVFSFGKIKLDTKIIVLFVLTIIVTLVEYFVLGIEKDWWLISNFAFPFGALFASKREWLKGKEKVIVLSSIVLFFVGFASLPVFSKIFEYSEYAYLVQVNLESSSMAIIVIIIMALFNKKSFVLSFLGKISYELYLIHGLFIVISSKFEFGLWAIPFVVILSVLSAFLLNKLNSKIISK